MDVDTNVAAAAENQPIAEPVANNEPAPAPEPVQSEPAPAANNEPAPTDEPETPKEKYVLYTDENGNKELKIVRDEEPQRDEPKAEPTPADDNANLTQNIEAAAEAVNAPVEPYNLNEFLNALTSDNIDESRIPAEYMAQYSNYKIQQAIEAKNKQAELAKQQQEQINQKLTPEQEQDNMKTFLQNLDDEAGKRAAHDVGMTEEDLENIDFMDDGDEKLVNYKLAKEWHRNRLMVELQERANVENTARQKLSLIHI